MVTAFKNEEGLWFRFATKKGGKEALIPVEIVAGKGPIVKEAVEECAAEMLEPETQATNSVSPKFTCDTNNHSCVAWRPAECSNGNVGCLHRKLRA